MSVTLQELVDRACLQAKRRLPVNPPNLELIAASLVPQVFQQVSDEVLNDERLRSLLTKPKTITFTDGVGELDSDVLTEFKTESTLYDPDDTEKIYSLVMEWNDFINVYDDRLGYFHITDADSIYVIEPGELYVDGEGISEDRTLKIACAVSVPASASTAIDAPNKVVDLIVNRLDEALYGEVVEKEAA